MRLERRADGERGLRTGSAVGVFLLVGAAGSALWLRLGLPKPICHFREWTGLPCPSCGSTRLVEALLAGDVVGALRWNPMVFLMLTLLATWAVVSTARHLLGLPRLIPVFRTWERNALFVVVVAVIAAGWGYLLWSRS